MAEGFKAIVLFCGTHFVAEPLQTIISHRWSHVCGCHTCLESDSFPQCENDFKTVVHSLFDNNKTEENYLGASEKIIKADFNNSYHEIYHISLWSAAWIWGCLKQVLFWQRLSEWISPSVVFRSPCFRGECVTCGSDLGFDLEPNAFCCFGRAVQVFLHPEEQGNPFW